MADVIADVFARRLNAGQQAQIEAAMELLQSAILLERAEHQRQFCDECEGDGEPEACGKCFPAFDDARISRRLAICKATGSALDEIIEVMPAEWPPGSGV